MQNRILENVPLSDFCTYRVGGIARRVVRVFDSEGLRRVQSEEGDKVVIGRGSKVLFSDDGFGGVVIVMSGEKVEFFWGEGCSDYGAYVYADAGVFLPKLVKDCCERGLAGLEWAVGIPGSVGGAVWMNAGAHGGDAAALTDWVELFRGGEIIRVSNDECGFGYRKSGFRHGDIITGVRFGLKKGDKDEIEEKMRKYTKIRREAQPSGFSCGSVFKAVVTAEGRNIPAWEFIDACDLRGVKIGGAEINKKHANFIMNTGGARAEDIKTLIKLIKTEVYIRFGVMLEEEVVYV